MNMGKYFIGSVAADDAVDIGFICSDLDEIGSIIEEPWLTVTK